MNASSPDPSRPVNGQLEPLMVAWALDVEPLGVVLVVETAYLVDAPLGVHLALPVVVPGSVERLLSENA